MVRQIVVFFIFLASATFFNLTFLPKQISLLLSFAAVILMLLTVVITLIYDRGKRFHQNFGIEVGLIFLSLFLAIYGAKWGHDQDFFLTIWVLNYMYFYLFYYFLHSVRMRPEELEKLILYLGIMYIAFYLIQFALYPRMIFGSRAQEMRGTIRIFLPGSAFAGLVFYYYLQETFTTNKKISIAFCLIYLVIPVIQGTRSSIITVLLGALLYILISKRVKSKVLVFMMMAMAAGIGFIIFKDIIMNLIMVSQEQASQDEDDVRVRAAKFFLYDFYPSALNYFIGNGESHMMSAYGMRIWYYKSNFGFYQNDLGILGEYIKFGVLWIVCVILIFRKLFTIKIAPRYGYIRYWALITILDELMGGAFSKPTSIVVITAVLYIIDVSHFELKNPDPEIEVESEELSVT
jgi:hypothetical protein